jgi:isoquinoline 1-oxidoreductase
LQLQRRTFLQILGSGLLITVHEGRSAASVDRFPVAARLLVNKDGTITAMSGKVEEGQGPRAELTQAAAEELRVPVNRVHLIMADTDLVPDDGITAGSRTTPRNIPEMRQAAATARELLTQLAAEEWKVDSNQLDVRNGFIQEPRTGDKLSYADLASSPMLETLFQRGVQSDIELTSTDRWTSLGTSMSRPNSRDLVTGEHRFPSDIARPEMLYGKVLRPPSRGAILQTIDFTKAETADDVTIVHEDQFVGVAAPTTRWARRVIDSISRTAVWAPSAEKVSNKTLHRHLREKARSETARVNETGSTEQALVAATKVLEDTYTLAYIQHAPMEPRAAVAEWKSGRLTVWTGCDGPFRARRALAEEFQIPEDDIRVIIPDMGSGFGGKHTAEAALEAARLAKNCGRPVKVVWTREEEFSWTYCRPAAVIECRAGLNAQGSLTSWEFTNINAGGAAIDTPYSVPNLKIQSIRSASPLAQGAYRCLGATGNNFARESFMDDLATAAGRDPLEFRIAHLQNPRLKRVLELAASRFGWSSRRRSISKERGIGLACGTEKNSVVAACAEVSLEKGTNAFTVLEVCEVFECGPILNPLNLQSQVEGCIIMGLGGALSEEIQFENGKILNPRFSQYRVPRFTDVPKIDVQLIDNPEIDPAGGGETPIIAVAPAIGNAVFAATGTRIRKMPMRA